MSLKTLKRIDLLIGLYAAGLCLGAFLLYGTGAFFSVLAGAVISFANWIMSRRLGVKLIMEEHKERVAVLLALKMLLVIGVIVAVLVLAPIEPVAFMVGLSVLVMGILSESFREMISK